MLQGVSRRTLLQGVLAALGLSRRAAAAEDRVVTLLADEYCPFNCAPGADPPGFGIEIARRILEPHGYVVVYEQTDWDAALRRVRGGEADAVIGAFKSDAPDFVFPGEPFGRSNFCYYVRPGFEWTFRGVPSLSGVRIGVIRAYSYGAALDRYVAEQGHGPRVFIADGVRPLATLFEALGRGEIQVLVEDGAVVAYHLRRNPRESRVREVACEGAGSLYVAFSPAARRQARSQKLARLWDQGLAALRDSGELQAIHRRYR
jgi:polar amino acid transport system substrate-binding protein